MNDTSADRVPCIKCGAMVLPITARLYNGQCAKCRREEIQSIQSKVRWKKPARPTLAELKAAASLPERKSADRWKAFEHYCYYKPTLDELSFLRETLRHQDCVLVRAAAQSIAKLGTQAKDAAPDLLDATQRTDPPFELPQAYPEGLDALLSVGADPEVVTDLIEANYRHENWHHFKASLNGLKRLGTNRSLKLLANVIVFGWRQLDKKQKRYVQSHFPDYVHESVG